MTSLSSVVYMLFDAIFALTISIYFVSQCGKKKKPVRAPSDDGVTLSARKETSGETVPKPPADKGAVAGTHDPNYQTLAGVDGNCFDEKGGDKEKPAEKAGGPKPGGPGMAATHDPNYQTLAGIGNDCFDKKDGAKASPSPNPAGTPKAGGPGMAATHDPNYQTLAGIGNDCFDKKK